MPHTEVKQLASHIKQAYGLEYSPEHNIQSAPCGIPSFTRRTDFQALQQADYLMDRFMIPNIRLYRFNNGYQPVLVGTLEEGYFIPTENYQPDIS